MKLSLTDYPCDPIPRHVEPARVTPWRGESAKKRASTWRDKNRGAALVESARRRAKLRGLPFDLDRDDIQRRVDAGVCEVTGLPFELTPGAWNAPSLDQIVAGAGYTKGNVRVVLCALNLMMNTWGLQVVAQIAAALGDRTESSDSG